MKTRIILCIAIVLVAVLFGTCLVIEHTYLNDSKKAENDETSDIITASEDTSSAEAPTTEEAAEGTGAVGTSDVTESGSETADTDSSSSEDTTAGEEEVLNEQIEQYLSDMTLEEKVAQLFVVLPEALVSGYSVVTAAGPATQEAINEIPVGGIVYMESNLQSSEQVTTMLSNVQSYSMERIGLPMFLCVDEEGGTVARIGNNSNFSVTTFGNMSEIGAGGDVNTAYTVGDTIGSYLSELGFNVDFAPVADVLTNSENTVVKYRSFGSDASLVSRMCLAVAEGLSAHNVLATYKHFPGHGMTSGDTHAGYAYSDKTLDEIRECELLPFQDAVDNNIPFIMVSHIAMPSITGDDTPASLSSVLISDLLRTEMGYDGIVITDGMNMGAITQEYSSAEAAVKALQAGIDIILMPEDFLSAYQGVIDAVNDGTLTTERIDESVTRILRVKLSMM